MADKSKFLDVFGGEARPRSGPLPPPREGTPESKEEGSCPAFGYLRGLSAQALAIEFRFRTGDSEGHSYNLLASWRHNPSVGLLLKFTGDVTTLVLIRGSNLDALVNETMNLTDRGLQRHRILYVREMDEDELRQVGQSGPTIDGIEVAEFESGEELESWLKKTAPQFVRKAR
jgi:hypothetical protein